LTVALVVTRFPEMNPGPVCRMDCAGKILLANKAARRVFGDERLVGRTWLEVCSGLDGAAWERIMHATEWFRHEAEVNGVWFVFAHLRDGDFEARWAEIKVRPTSCSTRRRPSA
jgi:PAS domain-containing protein